MNVRELIEKLQELPPDMTVLIFVSSDDIWGGDWEEATDLYQRTEGVVIT
jgi:hypothetical protein